MAQNEEMLEELYELLTLYFNISPHGGVIKSFEKPEHIEPGLDRVIIRKELLALITDTIMRLTATD